MLVSGLGSAWSAARSAFQQADGHTLAAAKLLDGGDLDNTVDAFFEMSQARLNMGIGVALSRRADETYHSTLDLLV